MPRTRIPPSPDPIDQFIALPEVEKERIWQSLDREFKPVELRPLTTNERKQWNRVKRKMGRPKIGKGAKVISVSMERDLLTVADAYAKSQGMTRTAVFSQALRDMLANQLRSQGHGRKAKAG